MCERSDEARRKYKINASAEDGEHETLVLDALFSASVSKCLKLKRFGEA
jgi:diphthamide synthase (EF-2-diphthine--ammonia ligase)